jgi:predicted O-methyltransferase YrrM
MEWHDSLPRHLRRKGMRRLSVGTLIRSAYLLHFSQPASDRPLLRAISRRPIRRIVEIGVGLGGRTERLLEIAGWRRECRPLVYTGIDLFESRRTSEPRLPLKRAFRELRGAGAITRLIPGDPLTALYRAANALVGTDLLLISADQDPDALAEAWRFVPRMLHPQSLVFVQQANSDPARQSWRQVEHGELRQLAAQAGRAMRIAA